MVTSSNPTLALRQSPSAAAAINRSELPPHVRQLRAQLDEPAVWSGPPPAAAGLAVEIAGVGKSFGARAVLQDIDLSIAPGEFVAIVGRSGCGKSTLLRLVAHLESVSQGRISLDGHVLGAAKGQGADRSDIRIMFQEARLLPWKRVIDNIALGLQGRDARERAQQALAQVGLADRANDWPSVLSGGQRQRVALARALVHRPRLLLLDEPLGALDALTRIEMHQLIESLWREHGFTALLVTHDVSEAVALADRVVLIEDHRVALDERVSLARPRSRTQAGFAAVEERVLQRVLGQPVDPAAPVEWPAQAAAVQDSPITQWRWAV